MSLHVVSTTTVDGHPYPDADVYIKMVCNWCHAFDLQVFKMIDSSGKSEFRQAFYAAHKHDVERDRHNRKIRAG